MADQSNVRLLWKIAAGVKTGSRNCNFREDAILPEAGLMDLGWERREYSKGQKENRAGWPGFSCVELDAVTSQRGATGAEDAFVLLRRVHRSIDLTGKRKPTALSLQVVCHASIAFDSHP